MRNVAVLLGLASLFWAGGCGEKPAPKSRSSHFYDADGYLTRDIVRPSSPPNLVVLLIDTLRADMLRLPGANNPGHMPHLAALAKQGVSFSNAISTAPWTLPAITSFVTGLMPHEHGINVVEVAPALSGQYTTFAEVLRNGYGFETMGFVASPWFDKRSSVWQGFRAHRGGFAMRGARQLLKRWIGELDPDRPFCLLLHSFEAHDPYGKDNHPFPKPARPPPPRGFEAINVKDIRTQALAYLTDRPKRVALLQAWGAKLTRDVMKYLHDGFDADADPELAEALRVAYTDGVRWVDELINDTVVYLREQKLLDDTLLVITSDHGEAFGEHGTLEHGRQLYDELVRIPLVMIDFRPDKSKQVFRGGRVFDGPVSILDIVPTFFDYAKMQPMDNVRGRSLLPRVAADDRAVGHAVFAEERLTVHNVMRAVDTELTTTRSAHWKYILAYDRIQGTVAEELFDLRRDPAESINLIGANDLSVGAAFQDAVEAVRSRTWGKVEGAERLRNTPYAGATGYVDPKSRPAPLPK